MSMVYSNDQLRRLLSLILLLVVFGGLSKPVFGQYDPYQPSIYNGRQVPEDLSWNVEPPRDPTLAELRCRLMYSYNTTDFLEISSSKSYHDEPLPFLLRFFGFEYQYIYIQKDGFLGFNKGLLSYRFPIDFPATPIDETIEEDPSMIAPFFALQDIPSAKEVAYAGIYLKKVDLQTESDALLKARITQDFQEGMIGSSDFKPKYALIITWRNMTFIARRDKQLKTNTYQAVIATDEVRTYAMFNYEQLEWTTDRDNYDGLKGSAAFIGFNAGNSTRAFEYKPYSQQPRILSMVSGGYGNGLKGRYFFQIDEEVWPGSCIDKSLDPNIKYRLPLSFLPRYGHMLGGTLVNVTGPCLQPNDTIVCIFDDRISRGVVKDSNHATCISPVVMYHGYVDLTLSVNDQVEFYGRFYIQPPDMAVPDVIVLGDEERQEYPTELRLKWQPQKLYYSGNRNPRYFAQCIDRREYVNEMDPRSEIVNITLWGYREINTLYPELTYIDQLDASVRLSAGYAVLRIENFADRYNPDKLDIQFGYIAIAVRNANRNIRAPILWSRTMPLAWYFRPQWERAYGRNGYWKHAMCSTWFRNERNMDLFATTIARCPCTAHQALQDVGRFLPDAECNMIQKKCETFHKGAQRCFRTGRPSVGGSGQTCCYDDNLELIQTADTMYGGRPSRAFIYGKHQYKMRMMIPALSNWLHDIMPFFYCCKWQALEDNSDSCQMHNYWRTSQDCSSYQNPAVGSVYGDPHFLTFDGTAYTFNGKGEFVLVRVDHPEHKLDVQGRFEQLPRHQRDQEPLKATQLTAVAAKDNQSAVIEFRIRPKAARWRYHMYVVVDQEYVFFWDESLRVQNFRGVTLYQPEGIKNMSHIIAMFDSGAGVEVMTSGGHMTAHIFLPVTFQNKTFGLLGNYSKMKEDDFVKPVTSQRNDGSYRSGINPTMLTQRQIHNDFAMLWRVQDGFFKEGVGTSLFSYQSKRFAQYDDRDFEPEYRLPSIDRPFSSDQLELPPAYRHLQEHMTQTCGDSTACRYDFILTLDKDFAEVTKTHESWSNNLQMNAKQTHIRCPALPKPLNGRKSENRYSPGMIITFQCDPGYRLVGYESRFCRDDGLWSWGIDPVCISEGSYAWKVIGISFLIILPFVLIIAVTLWCIAREKRSQIRDYQTGEPGLRDRFFTQRDFPIENIDKPMEIPTTAREAEC